VLELQNPKKQKGVSRIIYRANSRAIFKEIIVSENEVFIKTDRNNKNHTQLKTTKMD
jgi:predicted transcriptional regulator